MSAVTHHHLFVVCFFQWSSVIFLKSHTLLQVETIGDAYMVVGGVPIPKDTHAERVANFALGMRIAAREVKNPITGQPIQVHELICGHEGDFAAVYISVFFVVVLFLIGLCNACVLD